MRIYFSIRRAFTLIELIITVAVIAILAVFVVTLLNPTEYINRSRDANRVSEVQGISSAVALYARDNAGGLGTPGVTYLSLIDPNATTTAGTDCSGLGFPAGGTYHCAASSTARNVDGTGWIPVNLAKISGGSPLSEYPVDPVNSSSSGEYYEYATNGTDSSLETFMQSSKYTSSIANEEGSITSSTYKVGNADIPTLLYGMSSSTIFSINTATDAYTVLHTFTGSDGGTSQQSLILYNGMLYGANTNGGTNGDGTLFSFNPATNTFTKVHDFDGTDGAAPLVLAEYGKLLYGLTNTGGISNEGVVFTFDPSSNDLTVIHSFAGADGEYPWGLTLDNNILYGTTDNGGADNNGVIFSINPSNNSFEKLYDFASSDGSDPGSLTPYKDLLYGAEYGGGTYGYGTIFSFDPASNTYTTLYNFSANDGEDIFAGLTAYGGLLYGTAEHGGTYGYGTIFSFDPLNNKFIKIHDFNPFVDGGYPHGVLMAYDSLLYGTTYDLGEALGGSIFSINPENDEFSMIHALNNITGDDGWHIRAGITQFVR